MVLRRCPQCKSTTDDQYGFCLKCGYEFPQIEKNPIKTKDNTTICINCGFENPEEATFCVKCGIPLIFNQKLENDNSSFFIKYESSKKKDNGDYKPVNKSTIVLGYIFSILGGLIGLIFAIYLATRKDPVARKHGKIQLAIFIFYLIITGVLIGTGMLTIQEFVNMSSIQNFERIQF